MTLAAPHLAFTIHRAPAALARRNVHGQKPCLVAVALLSLVGAALMPMAPASAESPSARKESLFVMPLRGEQMTPATLSMLDDVLTVSVESLGPYWVSTRKDVDAELGREKLKDVAGCSDIACAAELAGAFGTRFILWGTVGRLGGKLAVSLNIIDTHTREAVGRTRMEADDSEETYSRTIDAAVRQLFKLPAAAPVELTFGPPLDARLPAATDVTAPTPPAVTVATPATSLSAMNARAEKLYEAAMDAQESASSTAQQKADAWCALGAAGASPYEAQAGAACNEWRAYVVEQPLLERARLLEAASPRDAKAVAAVWCRLADLRESHVKEQAAAACTRWTKYVEALAAEPTRLAADYGNLRVFVRLKRKTAEQKLAVLEAFLDVYGARKAPEVADARAAQALLKAPSEESAAYLCPGEGPRLVCGRASCPKGMVELPAGAYPMGDSRRSTSVDSFCIDVTEVTVDDYRTCVQGGRCTQAKSGGACNWNRADRSGHPVNCVDWKQATTYCKSLGKRLPTEEEWEWAARGADRGTSYPWGNEEPGRRACWAPTSGDHGTCEVGRTPTGDSPQGVHDLAGNVWEWTSTGDASVRVFRGGAWDAQGSTYLRATYRNGDDQTFKGSRLGFRCVRGQ